MELFHLLLRLTALMLVAASPAANRQCVQLKYVNMCVFVKICSRFPPPFNIKSPDFVVCEAETNGARAILCCPRAKSSNALFSGVGVGLKASRRHSTVNITVERKPDNPATEPENPPTETPITECGTVFIDPRDIRTKIINGRETRPGDWPWMALVSKGEVYCGGTLVSDSHVVTAAHCVKSTDKLTVRLGEYDKDGDSATDATEIFTVAQMIRHPDYNPSSHRNDIAILKLDRKVKFTSRISPACLPDNIPAEEMQYSSGLIAGWGTTTYAGPGSRYLRQGVVFFQQNTMCSKAYKENYAPTVNLCAAGGKSGDIVDSCQGDSGGPLTVTKSDKTYLFGVVSYGFRCAYPGFPGVYSRVTTYVQWLKSNMN